MGIVFVLLPISLLLAATAVAGFVWAARSRQFDDLDVAAARSVLQPRDNSDDRGAVDRSPTGAQP